MQAGSELVLSRASFSSPPPTLPSPGSFKNYFFLVVNEQLQNRVGK